GRVARGGPPRGTTRRAWQRGGAEGRRAGPQARRRAPAPGVRLIGTRLSSSAVAAYERDGFAFPIRVLSAAEAREVRLRLARGGRSTSCSVRARCRSITC